MRFKVEVIDTWAMTIAPVRGVFEIAKRDMYSFVDKAGRSIALSGRPFTALRIVRAP